MTVDETLVKEVVQSDAYPLAYPYLYSAIIRKALRLVDLLPDTKRRLDTCL
jgi:hypothetical protein